MTNALPRCISRRAEHRALLALVLTLLAPAAQAAPAVEVSRPWSRPAVVGATAAGFMTLSNAGKATDALVAVESPVAQRVEMHLTARRGGMASMQRLERVSVPAGGSLTFEPGGHHLMFLGLKRTLKTGEVVPATLVFASGSRIRASFAVGLSAPAGVHAH